MAGLAWTLGLRASTELSRGPRAEGLAERSEATDWQIDTLAYELYGLTDEEIAIVEGEK